MPRLCWSPHDKTCQLSLGCGIWSVEHQGNAACWRRRTEFPTMVWLSGADQGQAAYPHWCTLSDGLPWRAEHTSRHGSNEWKHTSLLGFCFQMLLWWLPRRSYLHSGMPCMHMCKFHVCCTNAISKWNSIHRLRFALPALCMLRACLHSLWCTCCFAWWIYEHETNHTHVNASYVPACICLYSQTPRW